MFPIEKNDPMIVACVAAPLGSGTGTGKSFASLELAAYLAEKYRVFIASNLKINKFWFRRYCLVKGYRFLASAIKYGHAIRYVETLDEMSKVEGCVIVADELGKLLDNRGFKDPNRKRFIHQLTTIRHRRCFLIYTAQHAADVDNKLREKTDNFVVCIPKKKWSPERQEMVLSGRSMYMLRDDKFKRYCSDPRIFASPLKTMWLARGQYKKMTLSGERRKHCIKQFFLYLDLLKKFCYRRRWNLSLLVKFSEDLTRKGFWLSPTDILFNCYESMYDYAKPEYICTPGVGLHRKEVSWDYISSEQQKRDEEKKKRDKENNVINVDFNNLFDNIDVVNE